MEDILVPIFSPEDRFLLQFAQRLGLQDHVRVSIMDPASSAEKAEGMQQELEAISEIDPERIKLLNENVLEKDFLQGKDLMIISLESWKKAVESRSVWLSYSPSVLIIRS